jgi:REP element-mobilizing transposase RayT
MADVYNRVFLHLVWATYDRLPKLSTEVRELAYRKIVAEAQELRCPVQAIGGIEDHVHVLVRFSTTVSIADLVKQMKGSSTRLINQQFPTLGFKWQGTYGVVPVSANHLPRVLAYIENQEEHHREKSLSMALEYCMEPPISPQSAKVGCPLGVSSLAGISIHGTSHGERDGDHHAI